MPEQKDTTNKPVAAGQRRPAPQRRGEDLSNYVFGKVQPQALPLEEAVLGAVMLDKNALTIIIDILQSESFYLEAHQHIYRAMRRLFDRSQPIDLLTVMEELKKSGDLEASGGPAYLAELTHRVASAANIEYHARIIAQKYIQRELIRVSTKTIRDAFEDTSDVFELLDEAEQGLYNIAQNNMSRGYEGTDTLAAKMLKQIEELKGKKDGLTGVPTGFTALDRLTSGWQPSDLIIVAARPAMGKTGFVLSMARNAALEFKKPVAIFSLEMANLQLVLRLVSMEAEISGSKLRNGQLDEDEWKRLHHAVERISEAPIFIDDTAGINIFELRAKARRMKIQHDIQLIVIDYLQLMSGGPDSQRGNREQEISSISRSLKALAKELNVPVIALSQLSRAVEVRGGSKRPQLSDLRECVAGDTLVYLADGSTVPIKDLVGQQPEIVTLDAQTQKLRIGRSEIVWPVGKKQVFQVKLASGRRLKTTSNHRLLTLDGWEKVVELKPGSRVGTLRRTYEPVTQKNELSENQIILLAHLIGDGSYLSGQPLRYTTASKGTSYGGKSHFSFAPSRKVLAGYAEILEDEYLTRLSESDIFWDVITEIVPVGEEEVFDLTVPGTHAFIANGIVSHNSGAIEQDADIVSFIYRPEYYQIMEDENGQSQKGVAEIIVAKHRNGATDTVKLRFTDKFARFSDLDEFNFDALPAGVFQDPVPANVIIRPSRMNDDEDIPF